MAKDSKDRIRRAALEVFVAYGYDAATTRQISAGAGLSEGAIYRHYAGKEAIAQDLFLSIHRRITDLIVEAGSIEGDLAARVRRIVEAYCELADSDWLLFSFHLLSLHRFLALWEDGTGDPVSAVAAIVRDAIARGEIAPGDDELLAGMALGLVTQVAQNKAYGRLDGPLSVHAPAFVAAVLAVLTARPSKNM